MTGGEQNARVAEAAVRWLGTPYRHQGATRGAGCDCLGLVRGIWVDLHGGEPETVPPYSRDWAERGSDEQLWRAALRHLEPGQGGAGDILLFRLRRGAVAKHLGVAVAPQQFIHAMSGHGVVQSALTPLWQRRIVARFSIPQNALGG